MAQTIADAVSTSTTLGVTFAGAMVNVPFQLFNNFIGYIIIVAVFGAALSIGWGLWRRFV